MQKKRFFPIGMLIAAVALFFLFQTNFSSAESFTVPSLTARSDCTNQGGSWSGSSDDIGTCTYPANSNYAQSNCGSNMKYVVIVDIDYVTTTSCVAVTVTNVVDTTPNEPPADIGNKCKLVDIDPQLSVGGTFNAKWIGVMTSIRFRQQGAGLEFITMIPGTLRFEQFDPDQDKLRRSADFSNGFTLDRGRWEASCWGPEGTFGTPLIVHVN